MEGGIDSLRSGLRPQPSVGLRTASWRRPSSSNPLRRGFKPVWSKYSFDAQVSVGQIVESSLASGSQPWFSLVFSCLPPEPRMRAKSILPRNLQIMNLAMMFEQNLTAEERIIHFH